MPPTGAANCLGVLVAAAILGAAAFARADASVVAPAAAGQQTLAVSVAAAGVRARVCTGACSADGGAAIPVPESARPMLAKAKARVVELEGGRHVVHVEANNASGDAWELILAAPNAGPSSEPVVVWSGFTGVPSSDSGDASMAFVAEEPIGRAVRIVVAKHREDSTICGRPSAMAAQALDPATLRLEKGASLMMLGADERAKAPRLTAKHADGDAPPGARLLRAELASSSVDRKFPPLTDGDLDSSWSEDRTGDGRGEFVRFKSKSEVPIVAVELAVRPTADVPGGAAPHTMFLVADDHVFAVTMPEDAWRRPPHARYVVTFPEPVRAGCFAVVLDEAFAAKGSKTVVTTLTEVTARTPYDGMSIDALVGALAGGGERARGAGAMLESSGAPAAKAVIEKYAKLDDAARELGRRVIDEAPCSEQAPFYGKQFAEATACGATSRAAPGDVSPDLAHARDRLRVCKDSGASALVNLVAAPDECTGRAAAQELVLASPAAAVRALLDVIAVREKGRTELIAALSVAARSARARTQLAIELEPASFSARPDVARLALLRAIGPGLGDVEGGARAFALLAKPEASFAVRYLLLAPAAELARKGDGYATEFLRTSLTRDADAHVRARAAEVASRTPTLRGELTRAIDDPEVRVREAAIGAMVDGAPADLASATPALLRRLATDDWTFVRGGAARALGASPSTPDVDRALSTALEDIAPDVRGAALDALGAHRAKAYASRIRERAETPAETPEVRAHALIALGLVCDAGSADLLTKFALRINQPLDETGRRLGPAAITALGALHPTDLGKRLEPLLGKNSPLPVRELAKSAMSAPATCR